MKDAIGIFDSGIGGLTVLREVSKRMPKENIIYLGDTARVPYGIRSPETVIKYSLQNARFLLKKDIKLLVVACNTASAVGIERLREELSVPVIGVIEPGARAAAASSQTGRIGVIGTQATVNSGAYTRMLRSLRSDTVVLTKACPLFVPLVEEGWTEGAIAEAVISEYLTSLRDEDIDTLVLGCTHYPLLKGLIRKVMKGGTSLIDSAEETAFETEQVLKEKGLLNVSSEKGLKKYYVTDSPDRFHDIGARFLSEEIEDIELVDI